MANNGNAPDAGNNEHRATYESFLTISKWGIGFVVSVLALLALFVVH